MSLLIIYPDKTAILPPMCCGSIGYYATMAQYGNIVIDRNWRYDKRKKNTHRYTIADTHGPLTLTIPVIKSTNSYNSVWNDIKVSSHGQWWNVHRVALESAYGRTPFFEFYIDLFKQYLCQHQEKEELLMDTVCGIDSVVRRILGFENIVKYSLDNNIVIEDLRNHSFNDISTVEYYQVRKSQLGFIPNLSILDLIFNMGPEAPVILHKMILEHTQRS